MAGGHWTAFHFSHDVGHRVPGEAVLRVSRTGSGWCDRSLSSWERDSRINSGSLPSGSGGCQWALATWRRGSPTSATVQTPVSQADKKRIAEELWREFFSDPSLWWDHRLEKVNARYPDFKHKERLESLWLNGKFNPPWVEAELAAMAPGTTQATSFGWNKRLEREMKAGQYVKTVHLFHEMQNEGVTPDKYTFSRVLNACASLQALEEGKRIHAQIIQSGYESDVFVGSTLVNMYAKCGDIEDARRVFNIMSTRDVVAWSALIRGYVKCGQGWKALELSRQMQTEGVEPNSVTFVGMLNACASLGALEEGKRVHEQIVQRGCESELFVGNSLLDMYAKCGRIENAERVFNKMPVRNVVTWSAMIMGYVKCGEGHAALDLSRRMQGEGVQPNGVTFVGMLNACASLGALVEGRRVHEQIACLGYESNVFVTSALVDMYAKCGSIEDAWTVFSKMPTPVVVAWNAMILGFVNCGQGWKALELSQRMQQEGAKPDSGTFVGVLKACANLGALGNGRRIHKQIIECGSCELDSFVGSCLVDMYAKCGSIEDARSVFVQMPVRNVVCWTAMLGGYAMHGHAKEALGHFEQMCNAGVELDEVTFISLLSACNHGGLVREGLHYFESMSADYGISATVEHYACMVSLLGQAGRLQEAEDMINVMPCEPNATVWRALLGACIVHGNISLGERVANRVLELDPGNDASLVLLSDIYAAAGKWDERASVQRQRLETGLEKKVGRTWIEVNSVIHSFTVDDHNHPQVLEIHAQLKRLSELMKKEGLVPDAKFVPHDSAEEEKVFHLPYHSEMLAIAFGLTSTAHDTPIRIFKNLRMCTYCHTAIKLIGKLVGRTIIVRDASRFHYFEDGSCSCRDYW